MYLSRVTKSTSPFKYVVPEKNMFMINEYWRMYYVLGILCKYSSTPFVEKQKSKTDMPNSNEFDEYLWVLMSKVLLLKCLWRIQDKHKCQQWQLRQKIVGESLKLCTYLICLHVPTDLLTYLSSRSFCLHCRLQFCYVCTSFRLIWKSSHFWSKLVFSWYLRVF